VRTHRKLDLLMLFLSTVLPVFKQLRALHTVRCSFKEVKGSSHREMQLETKHGQRRITAHRAVGCAAPNVDNMHFVLSVRSHSSATDGNDVKVENSSTLRAFPSVAARSAAVDGGQERKIIFCLEDDRAASGKLRLLSAPLSSPLAARCENAANDVFWK